MAMFKLDIEDLPDVRVVVLAGDVDAGSARELQKQLMATVAAGHRSLLVDLASVASIAGPGLRALVAAGERLAGEGGCLAVCSVPPAVLKVLDMAGMERTLIVHPGREPAVDWLREAVRQGRLLHLATRLLRKKEQAAGRPSAFAPVRPSDRSSLAISLLRESESSEGKAAGERAAPRRDRKE